MRPAMTTLAVLLLLTPLLGRAPDLCRGAFCLPAARSAAAFLGTTCQPAPDGYRLPLRPLPVDVTLNCGAAGFFALLAALAAGLLVGTRSRRPGRDAAILLAFCYVATLAANTTRIVLGWLAGVWVRFALPEPYWGGIHLGVGCAVFLLALLAAHAAMRWWVRRDYSLCPTTKEH